MQFEESVDVLLENCELAREGDLEALHNMRRLLRYAAKRADEDVLIDVAEYLILLVDANQQEDAG